MKILVPSRKAFADPQLLGHVLGGPTFVAMRALLIASQGGVLLDSERPHFQLLTGRDREPFERVEECHIIAGRRSGKTSGVAALAVYFALLHDYSDVLSPGERGVVLLVAENLEQSKILLNYVAGIVDASPALSKLVTARSALSMSFNNRIDVQVRAANFRSLRGMTLVAAICDEISFWRNDDTANPDTEILDAIRPGLVTTRGQLVTLGSPYAKRGVAYETFAAHWGPNGDPRILVAKGATRDFNVTVPQETIDRAIQRNPTAAKSEWLGEFRDDIGALLTREIVTSAVVPGRHQLPRVAGTPYCAFVDPSGGSTDEMTLAIAHLKNNVAILDCLKSVRPPFSPDEVAAEFARILKAYGLHTVRGDRFGGDWPAECFSSHGIHYETEQRPKNDIYKDVVPLFTTGRVELLDDPKTIEQFINLERRTSQSGKDSINHPKGAHDDSANAAAGALTLSASGDFDTMLTHPTDFLDDTGPNHKKAPVTVPQKMVRGVFATLAMDKEGNTAACYFALTKDQPHKLIILDFATSRYETRIFALMTERLEQLAEDCKAPQCPIYADKDLVKEAERQGFPARDLEDFPGRNDLGSIAAPHVVAGQVKLSTEAHDKAKGTMLDFALSLKYGAIDDMLSLAVVYGICMMDDPRASA